MHEENRHGVQYLTPGLVGGVDRGIGTVFTRSVRGGLFEDIVVDAL